MEKGKKISKTSRTYHGNLFFYKKHSHGTANFNPPQLFGRSQEGEQEETRKSLARSAQAMHAREPML